MGITIAACEQCRSRKVKCEKVKPCSHCRRLNVPCIAYSDEARPRGRLGGRGGNKKSLQARLERLEGLLEGLEQSNSVQQLPSPDESHTREEETTPTADKLHRYIAGPIWSQLSEQIGGLRELLSPSSDEEDEPPVPASQVLLNSPPPSYELLRSPIIDHTLAPRFNHPLLATRTSLLEIFVNNVDQVYKIIHRPTMTKQLFILDQLDQNSSQGSVVHAIVFSIYAAALMTLPQHQQVDIMGLSRDSALKYFTSATEYCLAQADYLSSSDVKSLQALIIYLLVVRTQDAGQKHWVLLGLAVQLARGLGLHCQTTTNTFRPLQREIRLRLWQVLRNLDFRAALDRGVEPIIRTDSYDTPRPLNVNDEDLTEEMVHLPRSRVGVTHASFGPVTDRGITLAIKLQFLDTFSTESQDMWHHRLGLVRAFDDSMKAELLDCDTNVPVQAMISYVAHALSRMCQLLAVRPMARLNKVKHQPAAMYPRRVLNIALQSLRAEELFFQTPLVQGFWWCTWNQWYVLAVALVEICAAPALCLDDDTWAVLRQSYERQSASIADTTNGRLWRPMKKLMMQVRALREAQGKPADLSDAAPLQSEQVVNHDFKPVSIDPVVSKSGLMIQQNQTLLDVQPDLFTGFTEADNSMAAWDEFLGNVSNFAPLDLWDMAMNAPTSTEQW